MCSGMSHSPQSNRYGIDRFISPTKAALPKIANSPKKRTNSKSPKLRQSQSAPSSPTSDRQTLIMRPTKSVNVDRISSDFYVSPLDWSIKNTIAVSLDGKLSYLDPKTLDLTAVSNSPDGVISLHFDPRGECLSLGCSQGNLAFYDIASEKCRSSYRAFSKGILVEDWRESMVISGDRTGNVVAIDIRSNDPVFKRLKAHNEEVCSVKMHAGLPIFATGSNDCTVKIWDERMIDSDPLIVYEDHRAGVRAMEWSPFSIHSILTGGGTNDKTIRLWDSDSGKTLKTANAGSQVCNLFWSSEYNEILSTHGFSQNHMALWRGSDLECIATSQVHKHRILFLSHSSDGSRVATAAPEDGICIYNIFPTRQFAATKSLSILR